METEQRTTIMVDRATWRKLNALKSPGDTFEDVIRYLLDRDRVLEELIGEIEPVRQK